MQFNYQKVCQKVLDPLSQRQKQVIERRFGLKDSGKKETLEAIGHDFGVTRERIRQIEADSFLRIEGQKDGSDLKKVFFQFKNHLKTQGGLKREDIILANLGGKDFQNQVYFLLNFGDSFFRHSETEDFYPFWAIEKNLFGKAETILVKLLKKLEGTSTPIPEKNLLDSFSKESSLLTVSAIQISKKIEKGPMGDYGLVSWPEIKPRGVKDRAYLALKKAGEPLHFREIAELSEELVGKFFQKREVLPQTVHNELIRDERFVLVGRGIYALREWGYETGTVKDIILKILKEKEKPVSGEEILKEVKSQRLVKENTVFLNLADRNYFLRDKKGKYFLRNS
ncbi:hypothetical protein KJA17_01705 [Patescibacteria group bacterium]|nr:hypothetical protein [Patescibacteria group bacterium]